MGVELGGRSPRCQICRRRHLSFRDWFRGDQLCSVCHREFPIIRREESASSRVAAGEGLGSSLPPDAFLSPDPSGHF